MNIDMNIDTHALYAALMHEVKNHLGLLAMNIDAIPATGEEAHDQELDSARLQCQRVIDRLQQALLFYKAQQHHMPVLLDAYAPADLLHEIADTTRALARGRFEVTLAVADDVPVLWFYDRNLLEMALMNAIHNSLSYARRVIRIGAAQHGNTLELFVEDDSDGFPAHVLNSLAEHKPYQSAGSGLGLQFAQIVIEAHENQGRRGQLILRNQPATRFSLMVP